MSASAWATFGSPTDFDFLRFAETLAHSRMLAQPKRWRFLAILATMATFDHTVANNGPHRGQHFTIRWATLHHAVGNTRCCCGQVSPELPEHDESRLMVVTGSVGVGRGVGSRVVRGGSAGRTIHSREGSDFLRRFTGAIYIYFYIRVSKAI